MTRKEHIEIHKFLHRNLDLLVADFISCTKNLPSDTSIMKLMEWSHAQTIKPSKEKI